MEQRTENKTVFWGAYFDRDAVLRFARFTGVLAWILLGWYGYSTLISMGQLWLAVSTGGMSFEGMSILDRLSILTNQFSQLFPGLVYFAMLKTAQQVLLILLDMEDNSRRAARK